MFAAMSPDDAQLTNKTRTLGQFYGQEVAFFTQGCFANLAKLAANDLRVSFDGHADLQHFGQTRLTPKQFLEKLIQFGFPFHKVKKIDLLGCEIGYIEKGTSYAIQFAEALYQLKETHKIDTDHIEVRAFNNLVSYRPIVGMRLHYNTQFVTCSISGFPLEQKADFDSSEKLTQQINEYNKYNYLLNIILINALLTLQYKPACPYSQYCKAIKNIMGELKQLQTTISAEEKTYPTMTSYFQESMTDLIKMFDMHVDKTISDHLANVKADAKDKKSDFLEQRAKCIDSDIKKMMAAINSNTNALTSALNKQILAIRAKSTNLYGIWVEPRTALDYFEKFLIKKPWLQQFKQFEEDRWILWAMINDRIVETNSAQKHQPHSFMADSAQKEVATLHRLRLYVLGCGESLQKSIEQVMKAVTWDTPRKEVLTEILNKATKEVKETKAANTTTDVTLPNPTSEQKR